MSDARISEANRILARIVSAANKGPIEGEDGFILGYEMSVGPIHAAIPFLQKQGIVVTTDGTIHDRSKTLEDAIREAKECSGLDPSRKYAPRMWVHNLDAEWRRAFWATQLERHADE